ncbi:MAG: nuclear transport factor 2 family protein [Acidimicrobiales bacterium]|nr:nuclear transport factor 2 family protein [Acidimicrobiales bacterium]
MATTTETGDGDRFDEVGSRLAEVEAVQAVTAVLHRYCRGLDRMDRALAESVWHPGGTADYEPLYQGTGSGFLDWVWPTHEGFARHSHVVTNVLVDVDVAAGTAASECYVSVWLRWPANDGVVRDLEGRGRYVDRWSCRDGVWAIDHRRYVDDLQRVVESPASALTDGSTATGRRGRTDPSYEVLS